MKKMKNRRQKTYLERQGSTKTTLLIVLSLMILWDFSLHFGELLGLPTYLNFSSRIVYTSFWTFYWGGASLISLIILGGNIK